MPIFHINNGCWMALVVLLVAAQGGAFSSRTAMPMRHQKRALVLDNCVHDHDVDDTEDRNIAVSRRSFGVHIFLLAASAATAIYPQSAIAAVDVSGLAPSSSSSSSGGSLADQLRAYDGSAGTRAKELQALQSSSSTKPSPVVAKTSSTTNAPEGIATWAYRAAPGFNPRTSRAGALGNLLRLDDRIVMTGGDKPYPISVEFPADWLQLDKYLGGLSFVDQRNGDRWYLLQTKLPPGEHLTSLNKAVIGDAIFSPQGTLVRSVGAEIDGYKVASGTVLSTDDTTPHRRFTVKYATITNNGGIRVERRGLVDAYEVSANGDVVMLFASSNAKAKDRDVIDAIVESFRIDL